MELKKFKITKEWNTLSIQINDSEYVARTSLSGKCRKWVVDGFDRKLTTAIDVINFIMNEVL